MKPKNFGPYRGRFFFYFQTATKINQAYSATINAGIDYRSHTVGVGASIVLRNAATGAPACLHNAKPPSSSFIHIVAAFFARPVQSPRWRFWVPGR
jgi:hypothetical protein